MPSPRVFFFDGLTSGFPATGRLTLAGRHASKGKSGESARNRGDSEQPRKPDGSNPPSGSGRAAGNAGPLADRHRKSGDRAGWNRDLCDQLQGRQGSPGTAWRVVGPAWRPWRWVSVGGLAEDAESTEFALQTRAPRFASRQALFRGQRMLAQAKAVKRLRRARSWPRVPAASARLLAGASVRAPTD